MIIEIKSRFDARIIVSCDVASFRDAVIKAVRERANLCDADLRGADLGGAYLCGADLGGADLCGAYLRGADLGGAYLCGADLCGADLRGADLGGADLGGAYLCGADLCGADLRGADLGGAYLCGADLGGANGQPRARLNWQAHALLSAVLLRSAGSDPNNREHVERRAFAGLIAVSSDWCWDVWIGMRAMHPNVTAWALDTLAPWVQDGDDSPEIVRERARQLAAESEAAE